MGEGWGGRRASPPLPLLRYLGCEGEGLGGWGGVTAGKRLPDKTVSTKENLYKTRLANKKNFFQSFLFRSVQNDKHHTNDNIEITFPQRGGAGAGCTTVSQLTGSVQWFFFFFCREGQGRGGAGRGYTTRSYKMYKKTRRPLLARHRTLSPRGPERPLHLKMFPVLRFAPRPSPHPQPTPPAAPPKTNQEVLCAFLLAGAVGVTPRRVASSLSLRLEVLRRRERDPVLPP